MAAPEIRNVYSTGGSTRVAFSRKGDELLVAGSSGIIRIYNNESEEEDTEPETLDILDEATDLAVYGEDKFAISSLSGEVALYSISGNSKISTVIRSALPIRAITFTHGGSMLVAAGDDDEVQIADIADRSRTIKFKAGDQVHDASYSSKLDLLALSLSNGEIKIFSLTSEEPRLITTIPDEIPKFIYQDDELVEDNFATARVEWHPNGNDFAIPTNSRAIKVYSSSEDYKPSYSFTRKHEVFIVDLKWSPDGEYIASADLNNRIIIWDTTSRDFVYDETVQQKIYNLSWSKVGGSYKLSAGSDNGDIYIFENIVNEKKSKESDSKKERSALEDILAEDEDEAEAESEDDGNEVDDINLNSSISQDGDDDGNDLRDFVDDDGFLDDDDNGGYAIPKKRQSERDRADDDLDVSRPQKKVSASAIPTTRKYRHKPYSPGCTPYISERRYLTMNSIGYVSSVRQDAFASITVSFFDQSVHREYHFDDLSGFDLAALTGQGILVGLSGAGDKEAKVLYRPHDNTSESWEKIIPTAKNEIITSISLSDTIIIVGTSLGYIRSFSLHGIPSSIHKTAPVLASATNSSYIFTVSLSNNNQLIYNLQDLDGRFLQRDLSLPLEFLLDGDLFKGVFFSSHGDPVIVGNDGVVLVLSRWRNPLQAIWIPILDSESKIKEIGGRGELSVWPLGLFRDNLNCIILRGFQYPTYPLPLPSELEVKLPIIKEISEFDAAEEELVRSKTLGELLGEALTNEGETFDDDNQVLSEYAIAYDRAVLKLFSQACVEEKNAKAWRLAQELKQEKALAASTKIAERVGLIALVNRINKLREQRMENENEIE